MKSADFFSLSWLAEVDHKNQSKSTMLVSTRHSKLRKQRVLVEFNDLIYHATYCQKVQLSKISVYIRQQSH